MRKKAFIVGVVALLVFSGWGVESVLADDVGLVGLLTQQLGVTEKQAEGGAGAIFDVAKEKLSKEAFGKVAGAVPEMNDLLGAAPKDSGLSGAIGGKTSVLGSNAEKLGGLGSLAGTFSGLGLQSDMVNKFLPIILSYVESNGGESAKNILAGVFQ
jgi:hypothetical protein